MSGLNKMYAIPAGCHLQLCHLHAGNSTDERREGHEYVTIAKLVVDAANSSVDGYAKSAVYYGQVLATATATCSPKDTPNRKRGRDIAVGRVLKQYHEVMHG